MHSVDVYLHFNGNCETAMNFYRTVFGGEFIALQRYKDVPGNEKLNEADKEKLIHISLKLTGHATLMATDRLDSGGRANNPADDAVVGNSVAVIKGSTDSCFSRPAERRRLVPAMLVPLTRR